MAAAIIMSGECVSQHNVVAGCQICEIFIKWEGLWCPCCGYRLRTKPRNLKYKAKLRARVEADAVEAKSKVEKSIAIKA